jgi:L-malate glycosyltransferase
MHASFVVVAASSSEVLHLSSKLRLCIIIDHIWNFRAGTENQLSQLLPMLAEHFDTEVLCLRPHPWLLEQEQYLKSRVYFFDIPDFKSPSSMRNWLRLVGHIRRSKPCIVHTFFPVSNILGVLAARAAGATAIVGSRRDFGEWMSRRYLFATRFANRFLDGIVTNSRQVALLTERVEHFALDRVKVIANAIDVDGLVVPASDLALKRDLGIPEGDAVVILVANYRPMKRHQTLVRAARRVLERNPAVSFLMIGDDFEPGQPKKVALRALAGELGVQQKLFFAHADGDIERYLSIATIGVNCSQGEGISNAIMEYMLAGIPVVAADSGGNPDLVADGETGLLFPLEDGDAMADRILRLLGDTGFAARLVGVARESVRTRSRRDDVVRAFVDYYRSLQGVATLDGGRSSAR